MARIPLKCGSTVTWGLCRPHRDSYPCVGPWQSLIKCSRVIFILCSFVADICTLMSFSFLAFFVGFRPGIVFRVLCDETIYKRRASDAIAWKCIARCDQNLSELFAFDVDPGSQLLQNGDEALPN